MNEPPHTPDQEAQHDATVGERHLPLRPLVGFAVVAMLAVLATAGVKSWRDLATAKQQEHELVERIDATRTRIGELEERVRLLDEDPLTLERLAREQLGMVRPGDVVIVLPDDEVEASASPPSP